MRHAPDEITEMSDGGIMQVYRRSILWLPLIMFLAACSTLQAPPQAVVPGHLLVQKLRLPARFQRDDNSTYVAHLDAIIIRPDDDRPHPLVVLNHGYLRAEMKDHSADEFYYQTMAFARRGWVAVIPFRRGYGTSEGPHEPGPANCSLSAMVRVGRIMADDTREVIRLMSAKPYVDASKIIALGHSGSGFSVLELLENPPPGLKAVINFAGSRGLTTSFNRMECNEDALADSAAFFARRSNGMPTLWVYAFNDRVVFYTLGKKMYRAFVAAGGKGAFIEGAAYEDDGHNLFYRPGGIPYWTPYVDAFLQKHGLQLQDGLISTEDVRTIGPEVGP
jgi:dienelactone hydrolase